MTTTTVPRSSEIQHESARLGDLDSAEVEAYLGNFRDDALGNITLQIQDDKLLLDAGEFVTELRSLGYGQHIMFDCALASGLTAFSKEDSGQPTVALEVRPTFTFSKTQAASSIPVP